MTSTVTETEPEIVQFTVIADAITVRTGNKVPGTQRDEVTRLVKDDLLNAPRGLETIETLLSLKSIRPTSSIKDGIDYRLTPKRVYNFGVKSGEAHGYFDKQVEPLVDPAAVSQARGNDSGVLTADDVR